MARLTILIALLAALALVVCTNASFLSRQICDKQIQQLNLKHCEKHIMHRIQQKQQQGQGEEEEEGEEENVLKLRGIRKWGSSSSRQQQQQQQRELEKCCNQLSELENPKCQCRALQQIFENQSERLQGRQQSQMMEQQLKKLPMTCGLGFIPRCDVNPDQD